MPWVPSPVSRTLVSVPLLFVVSPLSSERRMSVPAPPITTRRTPRPLSRLPSSKRFSSSSACEPASTTSLPSPASTVSARFRLRIASVSSPPRRNRLVASTKRETISVTGTALPSSSVICVVSRKRFAPAAAVASGSSSGAPIATRPVSRKSEPRTISVSVPARPSPSSSRTVPPRTPEVSTM